MEAIINIILIFLLIKLFNWRAINIKTVNNFTNVNYWIFILMLGIIIIALKLNT
jgi:hypothetical protein